jgi:2-polyprenyl-3-methyl-5-hydroxy-6-metoxy-1,4-benzoquinol methylase
MTHKLLEGKKWVGDLSLADAETLVRFGSQAKRILEFGVGGSTQILSQCMPDVQISLDTSSEWIEITKTKMKQIENRAKVSFNEYSSLDAILQQEPFDMIFVDGVDELRLEFALKTWSLLKQGGVMVFHDTRRDRDAKNVLTTALTYFTEVSTIELNIADSLGVTSNMSVIYKKASEPYVNWNLTEGKPMTAYHGHMTQPTDPLWEYPGK